MLRGWESEQGFDHFFNFLDVPVWTTDTSPSSILIDGMCLNVTSSMSHHQCHIINVTSSMSHHLRTARVS